jgi:hypothetical protein
VASGWPKAKRFRIDVGQVRPSSGLICGPGAMTAPLRQMSAVRARIITAGDFILVGTFNFEFTKASTHLRIPADDLPSSERTRMLHGAPYGTSSDLRLFLAYPDFE